MDTRFPPQKPFFSSYFDKLLGFMIHPIAILSYTGFCIFSFFYLDKPIASYFYQLGLSDNNILKGLSYLGSNGLNISCLFVLALFFRFIYKNKVWEMRTWFLWLCVLVPNVIGTILKSTLGRARPQWFFSDGLYGFYGPTVDHDFWSMPSGHASTIMGLMFGLMILFPNYTVAFMTYGLFAISLRLILLRHFLSDILVASYLALLSVGVIWYVVRQQSRLKPYFSQERSHASC